jgi:hypothetical protein
MIYVGAALLAAISPAAAQYGVPFGGPGMLTSPEAVSGALGASAAHSAQQQQCQQTFVGREGPRTVCAPQTESRPQR